MNTGDTKLTSVSELRRTLKFLAIVCLLGLSGSLIYVFVSSNGLDSVVSINSLRTLAIPVLVTSFLGAMFVFPVGMAKTLKWWLLMPREYSSHAGLLDRIYFPFSALVRPQILANPDTPARQQFIDALKWSGAGAVLILVAVTIGEWRLEL